MQKQKQIMLFNLDKKPLSFAHPTEAELKRSEELTTFLSSAGVYETKDEEKTRIEVLVQLDNIVKMWIKQVYTKKGLKSDDVNAKIFTFGSYRLGVHGPGSDIDTLCLGPIHASLDVSFFTDLSDILKKTEGVTHVHPVPDAYVPVLKFQMQGISIDLVYARLLLWTVPEDLDLQNDSVLSNIDEASIRSINGCRVTENIASLVPNLQNFRTTLRCIKLWAKKRMLYSNVSGYLGGINYAILVAKVCQLYPNAVPGTLVKRFFELYTNWNWTSPILICSLYSIPSLPLQTWDPNDKVHNVMPIITPAYPYMNSSYNVSSNTLATMMAEFRAANSECEKVESNQSEWIALFHKLEFFKTEGRYIQILVESQSEEVQRTRKGIVQSKLRTFVQKIERSSRGTITCRLSPEEHSECTLRSYFFIAIESPPGVKGELNLIHVTQEFRDLCGFPIGFDCIRYRKLPVFIRNPPTALPTVGQKRSREDEGDASDNAKKLCTFYT